MNDFFNFTTIGNTTITVAHVEQYSNFRFFFIKKICFLMKKIEINVVWDIIYEFGSQLEAIKMCRTEISV